MLLDNSPLSTPDGDLVAWDKGPFQVRKWVPVLATSGHIPSPASTSGKALLDAGMCWLPETSVGLVKGPRGSFSPTSCILQASSEDAMCTLVHSHTAVWPRNGALSSSRPCSSPCPEVYLHHHTNYRLEGTSLRIDEKLTEPIIWTHAPASGRATSDHPHTLGFFPPGARQSLSLHLPEGCLEGSSRNLQDIFFSSQVIRSRGTCEHLPACPDSG